MTRNILGGTLPGTAIVFGLTWLIFRNLTVAAVCAMLIALLSLYNIAGHYFDEKKRAVAGYEKHVFKTAKAYELDAPDDSAGPSLCIETGKGKCVLLNGQWIFDHRVYQEEAKKYRNRESDYFNGFDPPFSFPSEEFELWLSKLDGRPQKIIIRGDYIEPQPADWPVPPKYQRKEFALIDKSDLTP